MKVDVRYFASLREALGEGETAEVAEGTTVGGLRDALLDRSSRHAEVLARGRLVRSARNRSVAAETEPLAEGDEVAFFPPVTGG